MADLRTVLDTETGHPWQGLPNPETVEARLLTLLAHNHEVRPSQLGLQWRIDVFLAAVDVLNDAGWCIAFLQGHPYGPATDRHGVASLSTLTSIGIIHARPCRRDLRFIASQRFAEWLRLAGAHALSSVEAQPNDRH
jgi:hypothetical protein